VGVHKQTGSVATEGIVLGISRVAVVRLNAVITVK
jgi:hypothetical protein